MISKGAQEMNRLAQIAEEILNEGNGKFDYEEWTQWLRDNEDYDSYHDEDENEEDAGPFYPGEEYVDKYGNNYKAIFNALRADKYPEDYICGVEYGAGAFPEEEPWITSDQTDINVKNAGQIIKKAFKTKQLDFNVDKALYTIAIGGIITGNEDISPRQPGNTALRYDVRNTHFEGQNIVSSMHYGYNTPNLDDDMVWGINIAPNGKVSLDLKTMAFHTQLDTIQLW